MEESIHPVVSPQMAIAAGLDGVPIHQRYESSMLCYI